LFEPDLETVLGATIPRILEAQLYQALLESVASEHAARMMAMRNASDAAVDLIDDLTLTYNQLRQSSITQELSEISAGRLALGV
jgi:F-type H+-transporting ATPase subunit gamma